MPEQTFTCALDRDQALHVERRYGVRWNDDLSLDDAFRGNGQIPDIALLVEFESVEWPRSTIITLRWDDERDPDQERLEQLRGLLAERGVSYSES